MNTADKSFGFSDEEIDEIVLDSRKQMKNGLFVPIIGERADAHDYIEMAISNGAVAVLSSRDTSYWEKKYPDVRFYKVSDTRAALQEIGLMERRKFKGTVIGVTGSVGKTTTRSMIALALSTEKKVFETGGNANSQVGVPITMFNMARSGAEVAVIELGMSEPGEMHRIAETAEVDIALITNIGDAHLAQLKTRENILIEKLHILDGTPDQGTLIVNRDDPLLSTLNMEKIHSFAIGEGKSFNILNYGIGDADIELKMPGQHILSNALAAICVSKILSVDLEKAKNKLKGFTGLKGRGGIFKTKDGITVIDDSYNASPASMKASLSVLAGYSESGRECRKIAVLSDMLELGDGSREMHREIGSYISFLPIDILYLYGDLAMEIGSSLEASDLKHSHSIKRFSDFELLKTSLLNDIGEGDLILFKGSNSMGLSKIADIFRKKQIE